MKKIVVLGKGEESAKLVENVVKVANDLEIDFILEKNSQEEEIMGHGLIVTPALVVDGKVKCSGNLPKDDELEDALMN